MLLSRLPARAADLNWRNPPAKPIDMVDALIPPEQVQDPTIHLTPGIRRAGSLSPTTMATAG